MLVVVGLLAIAVAVVWLAPRALTMGRWQVFRPRTALAIWHAALAIGAAALVGCVVVSVVLATGAASAATDGEAVVATVVAWTALLVGGGIVAVAAVGTGTVLTEERDAVEALLAAPHRTVGSLDRRTDLVVSEQTRPFACAVPGPDRAVVISEGARALFTEAQLGAVVEHELAHLRGGHGLALRLAEVNAACLPRLRAARDLRRATRLLLELIADDTAAASAGAVHLANALVLLGEHEGDQGLALRAARLGARRWPAARLAHRRAAVALAAASA